VRSRTLLRAFVYRRGSGSAILAIAVIGCSAAALGPTYDAAARTSILQDTVESASVIERGFEVSYQGQVAGSLDAVQRSVASTLTAASPASGRLFTRPVEALQTNAFVADLTENIPLVWRSDVCAQLQLVAGQCRLDANGLVISESLAALNGWHVGQRVIAIGWETLTVLGIYRAPNPVPAYWFDHDTSYFPAEFPRARFPKSDAPAFDAMFTARETIELATGYRQGIASLDQFVDRGQLSAADLPQLAAIVHALTQSADLIESNATVQTSLAATVDRVRVGWQSLLSPVVLVTAQTLLLVWLLLFLAVTDAVDARERDIALAKLRGYGRRGVLAVALFEPFTLLALAWPIGVGVGWLASRGLAGALLRPGTTVTVPVLSWVTAGAGVLGGVAAALVAGRRVLSRPIVEQWRRLSHGATRRGWVFDAVVLTAAIAGLVELRASGAVTSAKHSSLALAIPALIGVAVAVVAARLLPVLCRAAFGVTARRGRLAVFLAVRQVARRPGGVRTTTALAAAFAMTSFGIVSWSVGHANRSLVADVTNGAPAVIAVDRIPGTDLASVVARIDPSGTKAMTVDQYLSPTGGGLVLLGVDPERFANIATWRRSFAPQPLDALLKALHPDAPPAMTVDGDALRVRLDVGGLASPLVLSADLSVANGTTPQHVDLGSISHDGSQVSDVGRLAGCPCDLKDLSMSFSAPTASGPGQTDVVVADVQVRHDGTWSTVNADITNPAHWKSTVAGTSPVPVSSTIGGLRWLVRITPVQLAVLRVVDRPDPLPALVSGAAAPRPATTSDESAAPFQTAGINGLALVVVPVADAAALPGAPAGGLIVDRTYLERAAAGDVAAVDQQVWTTPRDVARVRTALTAAGLHVVGLSLSSAQSRIFERQGPGLASVLYLAEASAAALLAAGSAVVSLVVSARRRRYEYAALAATGERPSGLFLGLFLEQTIVLVFGALVGIAAGLLAARLVVAKIPEFVTAPASVPLSYVPDWAPLAMTLVSTVLLLVFVATLTSLRLVAGVRADQLRETAT
jgi:putative ABC transport system permease protein